MAVSVLESIRRDLNAANTRRYFLNEIQNFKKKKTNITNASVSHFILITPCLIKVYVSIV